MSITNFMWNAFVLIGACYLITVYNWTPILFLAAMMMVKT